VEEFNLALRNTGLWHSGLGTRIDLVSVNNTFEHVRKKSSTLPGMVTAAL
jgi:hypothetical protein